MTDSAKTPWTSGRWIHERDFVYALNARGVNRMFAQVQPGFDDDGLITTEAEREATARLMAAAREMAEALEQCLGNLKAIEAENGWGAEVARAALAKAKGEQP